MSIINFNIQIKTRQKKKWNFDIHCIGLKLKNQNKKVILYNFKIFVKFMNVFIIILFKYKLKFKL